jgi:hypothetical protein
MITARARRRVLIALHRTPRSPRISTSSILGLLQTHNYNRRLSFCFAITSFLHCARDVDHLDAVAGFQRPNEGRAHRALLRHSCAGLGPERRSRLRVLCQRESGGRWEGGGGGRTDGDQRDAERRARGRGGIVCELLLHRPEPTIPFCLLSESTHADTPILGRKAVSAPTLYRVRVARPEERTVHAPAVHGAPRRTPQRAGGRLRAQSINLARREVCTCSRGLVVHNLINAPSIPHGR